MADREEHVIESAVAFPEPEEAPPTPEVNQLKRRQSVTEDSCNNDTEDTKRRRFSTDSPGKATHSPAPPHVDDDTLHEDRRRSIRDERERERSRDRNARPSAAPIDRAPRRRSGPGAAAEERKRGQRLFGALLGTLSQAPSAAAQRRRAEAEKKQAARLSVREGELDEAARAKKEELLAKRRREQVVLERQAMRLRHANMRAMARFLKTRTEPALYYKPWKITASQERQIEDQIEEVEHTIRDEMEQFEKRHAKSPEKTAPNNANEEGVEGAEQKKSLEALKQSQTDGPLPAAHAAQEDNQASRGDENADANDSTSRSKSVQETDQADHNEASNPIPQPSHAHTDDSAMHDLGESKAQEDEVMEEDKEDMVIY
ncbi:hypothetical protein KEM56_001851 [Ascosphaera pollenicola]|nr:hypothetical protein KEM56_001851 [Ascosphaera pollenicola]